MVQKYEDISGGVFDGRAAILHANAGWLFYWEEKSMLIKVMGLILFILIISGCATGANKQPAYQVSSQTYQQNTSSLDYEDVQPSRTTTYSTPASIYLSAKQIQRALKSAGFYQGSIDGKIGSKTREAIIKFQKANGLKADGIVGKRTAVELSKVKPL